jgi:hypothetical protein
MPGLGHASYGMLAYVFWHWPRAGVAAAEYEAAQRRFHTALAAAPPAGFTRSQSFALQGAPWAAAGGPAYEDWYLLDQSAGLDRLNHAAITASRQEPHDAAAALAAGGVAGLYTLRLGAALPAPTRAYWFAKPAGWSYAQLDDALRDLVAGGACVWMRYMVLGPTPEFCVHSAAPVRLPSDGVALELRSVWENRL